MTGAELQAALALHPRANPDFFDTLVALRLSAIATATARYARYRNTEETALFLDRRSPQFIGGFLEMANARLYSFWGDLTEALRTGQPQNEIKHTGASMFAELYSKPDRLELFMDAMSGISAGNFQRLRRQVRLLPIPHAVRRGRRHRPALDARRQSTSAPAVHLARPSCRDEIAWRKIAAAGLADRVSARSLDFFADPLPKADVITMGMILHDWNLEKKMHLIRAAYEALPPGGAFVVVENLIDDARRENAFGLMMSLNMLIEFGEAFDFTAPTFSDGAERRASGRWRSFRSADRRARASLTSSAADPERVGLRTPARPPT